MQIVRASITHLADADFLLQEYFESVSVVKRDSAEEIRSYLCETSFGLWLDYLDDFPAGCVALRPVSQSPSAAECKRLYVRPRFRGQGIAAALLDALEDQAYKSGAEWVYLDSTDQMEAAHRLYTSRGYAFCTRYNDNPQATVFLRKPLLPPTSER